MRETPRSSHVSKFLLFVLVLACGAVLFGSGGSQAPLIASVEPKRGITTPGSRVVVYGSDFSPDAVVYIGGLQARSTTFKSAFTLEVVTPYLRPGAYQIQFKSAGVTVRSAVTYTVLPAPIDAEIDHAMAMSRNGQSPAAIDALTAIAHANSDYQVRAFAYYQIGQIYFAQGDWWRWAAQPVFLDSDKSGAAVQTNWRYRVSADQSDYYLPTSSQPDHDLALADFTVAHDVTENPEPRFYRGLLNARYGNLAKAKTDVDFILKLDPENPSYRALAAYIAVLSGDDTQLKNFNDEKMNDARALGLLGEAAFLSGDTASAEHWWTQAAKIYPLGASLAYWAGKKHLARGQRRIAAALLTECTVMEPSGKEAKEAKDLLATLAAPRP